MAAGTGNGKCNGFGNRKGDGGLCSERELG
jgi:hypothetical protein